MPYQIVPFKNGYRVKSQDGKFLSKKPLTKENAHKQMIAVLINENLIGGSSNCDSSVTSLPYASSSFGLSSSNSRNTSTCPPNYRSKIGLGQKPDEKQFYQAVEQSYNTTNTAKESFDGFNLIFQSNTVKAYLNNDTKTIIIAIRGTKPKEFQDLSADANITINNLKNTDRYKLDKSIVSDLINKYSPNEYDYYLTGHSLGGAIVSQLKRDFPFFKDAVVYNSASQPVDYVYQQSDQIKRVYTKDDPLYALGSTVFQNKQVIPSTRPLSGTLPYFGSLFASLPQKAYNYLQGHALDNFKSLYGFGYDDGALHAIVFRKPITREKLEQDTRSILKKKKIPFIRETEQSFRVRNIPKTKFISKSFRTKVVNPEISLIFGKLKEMKGGVGNRVLKTREEYNRIAKEKASKIEQEKKDRYKYLEEKAKKAQEKIPQAFSNVVDRILKDFDEKEEERLVLIGKKSDPELLRQLTSSPQKPLQISKPIEFKREPVKVLTEKQLKEESKKELDSQRKLNDALLSLGYGKKRKYRK